MNLKNCILTLFSSQNFFLLSILLLNSEFTPLQASSEHLTSTSEYLTYGPLLLEQHVPSSKNKWHIAYHLSSDLSSPQYSLTGMHLGIDYWFTHEIFIGASYSQSQSKPLLLQQKLQDELLLNAVSTQYFTPQSGWIAHLGYAPLQGIFNLFNRWVIHSSLIFTLGAGATTFSSLEIRPAFQMKVEERLNFYPGMGMSLGLSHFLEYDTPLLRNQRSYWAGRTQVSGGIYAEF